MDDLLLQGRSFAGLFLLAGIAWLLGPRKKLPIVLIVGAIALQLVIATLLYTVAPFRAFLQSLTGVVAVSVVGPGTWVVATLALLTRSAPASMSAWVAV